jgi:type IV secretory pathway VirB2 component (pilin)
MRVASLQSKNGRAETEEHGGPFRRYGRRLCFALVAHALAAPAAWAGTGGPDLPWNDTFGTLLDALTGTTGRVLAGLMLVVAGVVWGFVRHEEGARRFAASLVGIALVFGALQVADGLAFAGGLF